MKFDVHRIEQVRIKIASVEAESPEEALSKTEAADLSAVVDRSGIDISLASVGSEAYASDIAHHDAAPIQAMVEIAGSHGEQGEHHFDFDVAAGEFSRVSLAAPTLAAGSAPQEATQATADSLAAPKSYLATLKVIGKLDTEVQVHVLIVARSADSALETLDSAARGYYGEEDDFGENDEPPYQRTEDRVGVVPGSVHAISPSTLLSLKQLMSLYVEPGCPMPLVLRRDEAIAAAPQVLSVVDGALGALDSLAVQVGQMRGMFDDDDESIQDAVDAGLESEEALRALRVMLLPAKGETQGAAAAQHQLEAQHPASPASRPRGG